jgi:hypothetical protein
VVLPEASVLAGSREFPLVMRPTVLLLKGLTDFWMSSVRPRELANTEAALSNSAMADVAAVLLVERYVKSVSLRRSVTYLAMRDSAS